MLSPDDPYWRQYDWSDLGPKLETACAAAAPAAPNRWPTGCRLRWWLATTTGSWARCRPLPCLSAERLDALIATLADDSVGGILAVPVAIPLKRADGDQRIAATLPRKACGRPRRHQMFRRAVLARALATRAVTDEAGAVEALGLKPRLVAGDSTNLKVTFPADLGIAESILRGRR